MPRGRGGGAGGGKRGGVGFAKPADPSFIRRLKELHGYKETADLDDKVQRGPAGVDDDDDPDGEMPTVVVLRDGDLSKEEADRIMQQNKKDDDESIPADGKIIFKKPTKKREAEEDSNTEMSDKDKAKKKKKKDKKPEKQLLSFDEDEEES